MKIINVFIWTLPWYCARQILAACCAAVYVWLSRNCLRNWTSPTSPRPRFCCRASQTLHGLVYKWLGFCPGLNKECFSNMTSTYMVLHHYHLLNNSWTIDFCLFIPHPINKWIKYRYYTSLLYFFNPIKSFMHDFHQRQFFSILFIVYLLEPWIDSIKKSGFRG